MIAVPIAVLSLAATVSPTLGETMIYRRAEILHGEWWRLASCHFVHLGVGHLAMNLAALFVLTYVFADTLRPREQAIALLTGGLAVGCGLLFAEPEVTFYAGLSGALHALFFAGAIAWLGTRPLLASISLAGAACKLAFELAGNAFWLGEMNFPVVGAAHRWGAAGGLIFGLALLATQRYEARETREKGET